MKKNDKIFIVTQFDGKGLFAIKKATITSYGKNQAHVKYDHNDQNALERFYVNQIENDGVDTNFLLQDIGSEAVEAYAMEQAKKYIAEELARNTRSYEMAIDPEYEYYEGKEGGYALAMLDNVNKFKEATPSFVYYADWCKERGYDL